MNKSASYPNSNQIYGLYGGGFSGQFTRLALILDVFTPLKSGPANAEYVSTSCQTSVDGIRPLLDYLSSMKVLEYNSGNQTFALTQTAATFLVRGEKAFAGDWVLANTDPVLWDKMLQTIQSGKSAGYSLPWAQDAWLESYSSSRVAYSLELWRTVGVEASSDQPLRILDLACGCGIKTLALAQANPTVEVTCVDSDDVLDVARNLAARYEITEKTTFLPADILADDLGTETYQAALLGLITYILTAEQNSNVFRRVFQALQPGGTLVIDAIMDSDQPVEWASRATLLMNTWNGGAAHSFSDYRTWLEGVGFSKVIQHNEQLLSAIK
jgi:trans-aconitate methyltransferase